jgi:hypothetical protein
MRMTFTFDKGAVTADLQPQFASDLHDLLSRQPDHRDDILALLYQIAYFEIHREEIIDRYPGLTVVVSDRNVVFAGTEDEAFSWVSENPWATPVYIVNLQRPDEVGAGAKQFSTASI